MTEAEREALFRENLEFAKRAGWITEAPPTLPVRWWRDYELECLRWHRTQDFMSVTVPILVAVHAPDLDPMAHACHERLAPIVRQMFDAWQEWWVFHPAGL